MAPAVTTVPAVPSTEKGARTFRFLSRHSGRRIQTVISRSDPTRDTCHPAAASNSGGTVCDKMAQYAKLAKPGFTALTSDTTRAAPR